MPDPNLLRLDQYVRLKLESRLVANLALSGDRAFLRRLKPTTPSRAPRRALELSTSSSNNVPNLGRDFFGFLEKLSQELHQFLLSRFHIVVGEQLKDYK